MKCKKMLDICLRKNMTTDTNSSGCLFSKYNNSSSEIFKIGWDKFFDFWEEYCIKLKDDQDIFSNSYLYEYNIKGNQSSVVCFYSVSRAGISC